MKLKENLTIRKIGNDYMIVAESSSGLDYTRVISLNETAAYLVQEVEQKEFTKEDWVTLLLNKYDIKRERATADVENLIEMLSQEELFEE